MNTNNSDMDLRRREGNIWFWVGGGGQSSGVKKKSSGGRVLYKQRLSSKAHSDINCHSDHYSYGFKTKVRPIP